MRAFKILVLAIVVTWLLTGFSHAWHDETHIAIARAAGYSRWYNVTGADMAKIKAGRVEAHNHYVDIPRGTVVSPEMVLAQVDKYNKVDETGHLYGAIIASLREYIRQRKKGKYGAYHLAYCAHYVGDLSQPLHNTAYNAFNREYHQMIDGIIDEEIVGNLHRIPVYRIAIRSEEDLAREIARIANISLKLGYRIEAEQRPLTRHEAYVQVGHSVSLLKAILSYVEELR